MSLSLKNLSAVHVFLIAITGLIAIVTISVYTLLNNQTAKYWYQDRTRDTIDYTLFVGSSSIARLPVDKVEKCKPTVIYGFENGVAEDILAYLNFAQLDSAKRIVLYIGENDIAQGEHYSDTLEQVNSILNKLMSKHGLEIGVMTIKPSPRRHRFHTKFKRFNEELSRYWSNDGVPEDIKSRLSFIPFHLIDSHMYYSSDGIHLNNAGYNALSIMIDPFCENKQ